MINTQSKAEYAFLGVQKFKDFNKMQAWYEHASRINPPINADPEGEQGLAFGKEGSWPQLFKDRIKEAGYKDKDVKGAKHLRKNAVLGYSVVLTCPKSKLSEVDVEQQKKDNIDQLNRTFNKNPERLYDEETGTWKTEGNNVAAVYFHGDEPGSIHFDAYIIPMDENERLNSRGILNGAKDFYQLQDSYGELAEKHGLKRGEKFTRSSHEHITKLYTALEKSINVELPPALPSQSAISYRKEANEMYKEVALQATGYKQQCETLREQVEANIREAKAEARKELAEELGVIRERNLARTADKEFGSIEDTLKAAKSFKYLEDEKFDDEQTQEFVKRMLENAKRKAEEDMEKKRQEERRKRKEQEIKDNAVYKINDDER